MTLTLRTGLEIELTAPPDGDRRALAEEVAARCGGRVEASSHTDSEPSLVPDTGHSWHPTRGFEVRDAAGGPVCSLGDDARLLRPVSATTDPGCALQHVLDLVEQPDRGWPVLQAAAAATGLTKHLDVNFTALLTETPFATPWRSGCCPERCTVPTWWRAPLRWRG